MNISVNAEMNENEIRSTNVIQVQHTQDVSQFILKYFLKKKSLSPHLYLMIRL